MKRLLLLFLIFPATLKSQQIPIKGIITVQNSKTNTGKVQYVKNVQVEHPKAKPTTSDDEGKFTINIVGIKTGNQIGLDINPPNNLLVVNDYATKDLTLGRMEPIKIWLASRADLDKRKADMIGINTAKLTETTNKRIIDVSTKLAQAVNDKELYKKLADSLTALSTDLSSRITMIEKFAEDLVKQNLDDCEENYRKAYDYFSRGDLDSVQILLQYDAIVKDIENAQEKHAAGKAMETAGKMAQEQAQQTIGSKVKELMLLAKTQAIENKHDAANKTYKQAVATDSLNSDNVFEYARYLQKQNQLQQAEKLYEHLLTLVKTDHVKSSIYINLGQLYTDWNNFNEADKYLNQALEICERLAKDNPQVYEVDLAATLNNLGTLYKHKANYAEAEKYYMRSLNIRERLSNSNADNHRADYAATLNNIGLLYYDKNDNQNTEQYFLQATEIYTQLAKINPQNYEPKLSICLNNLGIIYTYKQNYVAAQQYNMQAYDIRMRLAKANPQSYEPLIAQSMNNLATLYSKENKYTEAEKYYLQTSALYEQLTTTNPNTYEPFYATSLHDLGNIYWQQNKYDMVEKNYLQALKSWEHVLTYNYQTKYEVTLAVLLGDIAMFYMNQNKYDVSVKYNEQALKAWSNIVDNDPNTQYKQLLSSTHIDIGWACLFIKNFKASEDNSRAALKIDDSKKYIIFNNLALALLMQNKYTDAEVLIKELKATNDINIIAGFANDLAELEKAGIIPESCKADIEKAKALMQE